MSTTIKSIKQYIELIEQITENNKTKGNKADIIFRGQPVDKPLLPKLARLTLRGSFINLEKLILEEFKRGSYPLTEFKPENRWDILALAQHHGLPTRLLDWSYSALVALWFAVCNPSENNENGIVWILAGEVKNFINDEDIESKDPLTNDTIRIFRSKVVSRRISAQSGLFTIHKIGTNETIAPFEDDKEYKEKLTKVTIHPSSFAGIRKQLHILGVNSSTIFPDIDGFCKHLEWRYSRYSDESKINKGVINNYYFY